MTLWGGRFAAKADPLFRAFNDSLSIDWRLVQQDIAGSIAWADALCDAGVLNGSERDEIANALKEMARLAAHHPEAIRTSDAEDVHSWVETQLIERVGNLGKKLHTGRSRNDQVATDLRLWLREAVGQRRTELQEVQRSFIRLARREIETVFPGYTHLQRAQPILFAHWCLAYVEMLQRDVSRFSDAAVRANECPLGSGALAGTAYAIDRVKLAHALGFDAPTRNSIDAVSDRDCVVEVLSAVSLCAVHLSRCAEDLIVYSSAEFGLIELTEAFTSGSSIMPQKKNPDALELIRGKSGRLIGEHVAFSVTLKGLPLAYNKDLQEDKRPLFSSMDELSLCLRIMAPLLDGVQVKHDRAAQAAAGDHSNATDLADYLVEKGVPFRDAHEQAGRAVRLAIERAVALEMLPITELQTVAPAATTDIFERLTLASSLQRRNAFGGTSPSQVQHALDEAEQRIGV